jgi:hypothetical protein
VAVTFSTLERAADRAGPTRGERSGFDGGAPAPWDHRLRTRCRWCLGASAA